MPPSRTSTSIGPSPIDVHASVVSPFAAYRTSGTMDEVSLLTAWGPSGAERQPIAITWAMLGATAVVVERVLARTRVIASYTAACGAAGAGIVTLNLPSAAGATVATVTSEPHAVRRRTRIVAAGFANGRATTPEIRTSPPPRLSGSTASRRVSGRVDERIRPIWAKYRDRARAGHADAEQAVRRNRQGTQDLR